MQEFFSNKGTQMLLKANSYKGKRGNTYSKNEKKNVFPFISRQFFSSTPKDIQTDITFQQDIFSSK